MESQWNQNTHAELDCNANGLFFFFYIFHCSSTINEKTKEKVAIKKLHRPFQSEIFAKRAYRELRLLKHMKHENVSRLYRFVQLLCILDMIMSPDSFIPTRWSGSLMCSHLPQDLMTSRICEYFFFTISPNPSGKGRQRPWWSAGLVITCRNAYCRSFFLDGGWIQKCSIWPIYMYITPTCDCCARHFQNHTALCMRQLSFWNRNTLCPNCCLRGGETLSKTSLCALAFRFPVTATEGPKNPELELAV